MIRPPMEQSRFTVQCAWCLRVQDARGNYTIAATVLYNRRSTDSHGICGPCAAILQGTVIKRASVASVFCPQPVFDNGLCEECGATTVDHLIDRSNVAAAVHLRAGCGPTTLSPIYRTAA